MTSDAGGENVLGQELSFTWWVVLFELFVLLAAIIHLTGRILQTCYSWGTWIKLRIILELMALNDHWTYMDILLYPWL